jgi:hypothetical protein
LECGRLLPHFSAVQTAWREKEKPVVVNTNNQPLTNADLRG